MILFINFIMKCSLHYKTYDLVTFDHTSIDSLIMSHSYESSVMTHQHEIFELSHSYELSIGNIVTVKYLQV